MSQIRESGRRGVEENCTGAAPPPHPGPCRPLSGPAPDTEMTLGKTKAETGISRQCQMLSCPASDRPHGQGDEGWGSRE